LQEELSTLSRFDTELKELDRVIKEKKAVISAADLKLTQAEHDIQNLNKDKTAAVNHVSKLEQQYTWIVEEKALVPLAFFRRHHANIRHRQFGKQGTQYDFTGIEVQDLRQRCEDLENSQKGMKKKLNPKVMNMIDRSVARAPS